MCRLRDFPRRLSSRSGTGYFFVPFRRHARAERFLIEAAVPVRVLKANGTILFFLRRYCSARRLLICGTAAKHSRTRHYHKE
jgi:hypothetical protein